MIKNNIIFKEDITKWQGYPSLVNRPRCYSFNPADGCLYCNNKSFRYHSTSHGKKYYQCEKCCGINH